jgi:hypothetical protein
MGILDRRPREEHFWAWFQKNSVRLFAFESDRGVLDELSAALHRVERGLTFELGPPRDGKREFIVSADGIRDRFDAVRKLVAAAPALDQWTVIPFRPPKDIDQIAITFGQQRLAADDLWIRAERDGDRVGLNIFVRRLTEENREMLSGAVLLLLDSALGEYAVETQVGFIEIHPLPAQPAATGLQPFREIRASFDTQAH